MQYGYTSFEGGGKVKFHKMIIATALITALSTVSVFASPAVTESPKTNTTQQKNDISPKGKNEIKEHRVKDKGSEAEIDPIEKLKNKKQKVRELLDAGKITKEEADDLNAKIGAKIKEIEEFNKLTVEQKREKLTKRFKEKVDRKVKEGKLPRKKADQIIKEFNKKIEEWDGSGYPSFMRKSYLKKHKCK